MKSGSKLRSSEVLKSKDQKNKQRRSQLGKLPDSQKKFPFKNLNQNISVTKMDGGEIIIDDLKHQVILSKKELTN